jgi:ABC-2 type transport system permease protein
MRAALLIAAKDLRQRLRDRSALMVALVVPLGLAFIFSRILSGVGGGNGVFSYAVVDLDRGSASRAFVHDVLGGVQRQRSIDLRAVRSVAAAREQVSNGTIDAAFVIPAGFTAATRSNRASSITVVGNADAPIATQVARSIAEAYAADVNAVRLSVAAVIVPLEAAGRRSTPEQMAALAHEAAAMAEPVTLRDVTAATRQLDATTYLAAGMAVFFLFFTVQFGVSSLLEERNDGTLARLIAAPIPRASILVGKMLTSFLLGCISMSVLALASTLLFGAHWGNPAGVAVLIVCGVLAAMGIMALVATMAKTAEQAGNWQAIIAVVLGLLGGTFFAISQAPPFFAKLSLITPQAWFLRGLGDLHAGHLSVVVVPALAMLAFAAVTGGIAALRLDRIARPSP